MDPFFGDSAHAWFELILMWVGFGTFVGLLAKALMPGRDPGGPIATLLMGITGVIIGCGVYTLVYRAGVRHDGGVRAAGIFPPARWLFAGRGRVARPSAGRPSAPRADTPPSPPSIFVLFGRLAGRDLRLQILSRLLV